MARTYIELYCGDPSGLSSSLDKFIESLTKWRDQAAKDGSAAEIRFRTVPDYGGYDCHMEVTYDRPETPEERQERERRASQEAEWLKKRELAELQRLMAKHGKA